MTEMPIGARVRLRAPHRQLTLRSDLGTVEEQLGDDHVLVRLDEPAVYDSGIGAPLDLPVVFEMPDNLDVVDG